MPIRTGALVSFLVVTFLSVGLTLAEVDSTKSATQRSSIADRLQNVKHVGVAVDDKLGGVNIHVFSSEQHKDSQLAAYKRNRADWQEQKESFVQQLRDARARGASVEEVKAMMREREDLQSPSSRTGSQIQPHNVVLVGTDYLEIQDPEIPESTTLIPFTRICRVIMPKERDNTSAPAPDTDSSK